MCRPVNGRSQRRRRQSVCTRDACQLLGGEGQSTTLTVAFQPEGATDKSFRAVSADKTKATVSVSGMTITVNTWVQAQHSGLYPVMVNLLRLQKSLSHLKGNPSGESAMFLKTESFEHNGVTVTLSPELSALQRIEHLALMKRQAEQAEVTEPEVYCGRRHQNRCFCGGYVPVA